MSRLRQINLSYDRREDRLLLRVSTADQQEHRLWLTRSLIRLWWPKLVEALRRPQADQPPLPQEPSSREAVQAFRHEAALSKARFGEPYAAEGVQPVQAAPLLVVTVRMTAHGDGEQEFSLLPAQGAGVNLRLTADLLHAFVKLLQEGLGKAAWDLGVVPPFASAMAPPSARLN